MPAVPSDICVFVAVRVTGRLQSKLLRWFEAQARSRDLWTLARPRDAAVVALRNSTQSLDIIQALLTQMGHEKAELREASELGIAVEAGEADASTPLERNIAVARALELSERAHSTQVVLGPAMREIARQSTPPGFSVIDLGEIRLGGGIAAEKVAQLRIAGFPSEFPSLEGLEDVETNLGTPPQGFIGRDKEQKWIRKALASGRVVTIAGPGGVGKSALAYYVAYDYVEEYRDGAWKVDLSSVPRGGNVATAVAAEMRIPPAQNKSALERVLASLASMDGLLLLDNCEHLVDECRAFVEAVVRVCPKTDFLIASRAPLELDGEQVLRLKPFAVPEEDENLENAEAVRLFLDRVRRIDSKMVFGPSDLILVASICKKVDGLPLALELAAGQAPIIGLRALNDGLKDALGPATTRRKGLKETLQWSYSLLTEEEQRFFRRLGVLTGSTGRTLALAAGSDSTSRSPGILDLLERVSLVQTSGPQNAKTYRLLEPVRQFALDKLDRESEERDARSRFANECLLWIKALKAADLPSVRFFAAIRGELANLEASLTFMLADPRLALSAFELCLAMGPYWLRRGPYDFGYNSFSQAIEKARPKASVEHGRALNYVGLLANYSGFYEPGIAAFLRARKMFGQLKEVVWEVKVILNLAILYRNIDRVEEAAQCAEEAIHLIGDLDHLLRASALCSLAMSKYELGRFDESRQALLEATKLNEELGDFWTEGAASYCDALLHLAENDSAEAEAALLRSLANYRRAADRQGFLCAVEVAGFLAIRVSNYFKAARLIAGADKYFKKFGVARPERDVMRRDKALNDIEQWVGKEQAEAYYFTGAILSEEELFSLAQEGATSFA